ncbi:MAG: TonB-dependent receptor [Burkholderiales bacterium]|nr:TonB-dependent receptor [Burkholderiales bacterium]
MPVPLGQVVGDVTIIGNDEIERGGYGDLATLLSREGGLEFDRNGGPGTATGVFTRGAPSRFTAVLIDGVRVDSQNLQGGATWSNLPLSSVDHIEIVRGPSSALYGSDAVAGVVQIFTKKGQGKPSVELSGGLASRGTRNAAASIRGSDQQWDYALSMSTESGGGHQSSIVNPSNANFNADPDPYRLRGWSARLGWDVTKGHRLELTSNQQQARASYDDGAAPTVAPLSVQLLDTLGVKWQANWSEALEGVYSIGQSRERLEFVGDYPFNTTTDLRTATVLHRFKLNAHNDVQALLERREDALINSQELSPERAIRSQNAASLAYDWHDQGRVLQAKVRQDQDSNFGRYTTGALAGALQIDSSLRLRSSYGTGFRAPTLYERLNVWGGNPDLTPEESRSFELGADFKRAGQFASATWFSSHVNNLIDWETSRYENVGKAKLQGLSIQFGDDSGSVRWKASFDNQSAKNAQTDLWLVRRARNRAGLQLDTDVAGWTIGGRVAAVGARFDDVANQNRLGGYALFDGWAQRNLGGGWSVLLRLDNALDHRYQLAKDYSTPGRTGFIGLKWTPAI